MTSPCSTASLESALAGNLPAEEEASLHRHLETCEVCRAAMVRIAGGVQWCQEAATLLTDDEFDHAILTRDEWSEIDFTVEHLEPSDEPNVLGRLGGYDVLEIIGRGGMGVVLKAFDRELKRCVAIKMLAPHLAQSSLAKKRFAREAQAAAAIVHPHVLAIHQVQPNGPMPFLVMPLVAGESLAARLAARGTLELKEILRIGMQAAAGLAAAHEQGLVHRDVKPANILLEMGIDRAVLTDFGLARAADDVAMTHWGVIAGTPQYMSPEQARGEPLDGRSDLFSLGCVLYEMATGVSPFRADSTMATMRRLVDDSPQAMASLNPELPPWFIAIVDCLLEKDPANRFGSAKQVSELLEGCLAHVQRPTGVQLPVGIPAIGTPRFSLSRVFRLKGFVTMSAALGVGLLSVVLLHFHGLNAREDDAARQADRAKVQQVVDADSQRTSAIDDQKTTPPRGPAEAGHPKVDSSLLAQGAEPSAAGNESDANNGAPLGLAALRKRTPLPTVAEKKRATNLVRSIYKADFESAKTPSQKAELAKKLLGQGKETANDQAGKFVLLKSAQELAETAGDLATALAAWDELSADFEVNSLEGRWDVLKKFSNTKDLQELRGHLEQLHEAAAAEDQFEIARNSLELLVSKSTPKEAEQYQADLKALDERIKRHSKAEAAFKSLDGDPADAGANAVAGEYLCVFKQDWSRGVALLARGNNSQLKKLAKLELADTTGTAQQLTLADAWWDYGDKQLDKAVKAAGQERASFWYSEALPQLGGLDKLKAEKRIATTLNVTDTRAGIVRWHVVGVIDGKDKIVISRKGTKWEHLFADWPTAVVVNGKPWTPKQTPEIAFDALEQAQMKTIDFNLTKLRILRARGEVKLEIHPDDVVILVDDGPQRGSDKYEFEIVLRRQGRVSNLPLNQESKLEPRDQFSIKALSGVPDADDPSEAGAKPAAVRVKESNVRPIKLHCKSNLDPKTHVLTLTYDWASNDQLLDFDLKQTKPVLEEGALKLQRGQSIRHVVDFAEVTITAQVLVPEMNGNLIGTSGGAVTYLGGARQKRIYLTHGKSALQREVPIPQRTGNQQIELAFTARRLAFDFGNAPGPSHLEMTTQNFHAGHLDLSGGEVGYEYGTLIIRGKLDDASAAQFLKTKAATEPVANPDDTPSISNDESR